MKLVFKTMPVSTNHMYGRARGRTFLTDKAREAKDEIGWEARLQFHGEPYNKPIAVTLSFFWPTKRKRDADNSVKMFQDALTGIVWEDDSLITDLVLKRRLDRSNPRIELEIAPGWTG